MTTTPVVLLPAPSQIPLPPGGTFTPIGTIRGPLTIAYGPIAGGVITNPLLASDQGIENPEVLYVNCVGAANSAEDITTIPLQPGQSFNIPPGQTTNVSVNAATPGHRFSAVIFQVGPPYPPTPTPGDFPPPGPTTVTQIIPSYLYVQYNDDDDLQAWVAAYNSLAQGYCDWFTNVALPVYTGPMIVGPLLDLVAQGIYGVVRPALASGLNRDLGPFNTYAYNVLEFNQRKLVGPTNVAATSDDVFKRIITWNFYKGDGNVFSVPWLKRRVMRFLTGANGTAPNIDNSDFVSVSYAPPNAISIRISVGTRRILGGALFNRFGFNEFDYNGLRTLYVPPAGAPFPLAPVFKEAMDAGVLQMPFQYKTTVIV